ncbi:hypothetical protein [Thermococcus sp. M36]|nr:hypothetical protein [Thermococcus sp. M36]
MDLRRAVKGLVRAHAGFAIVRVNSLGKVYPEKTSVDVLEVLRRRLGKE